MSNSSSTSSTAFARVGKEGYKQAKLAARLAGLKSSELIEVAVKEWVVRRCQEDPAFKKFFNKELQKTA